ncbi:serine hydrolase FSH [Chaetomium strumarium]|uniref:Serine hydrolase FSH n=1 Tax=Chaetomium strumarium TaxID=1170767 RepID=A0AAJ0GRN7_9PEZI|nr:serine hydrolase FSH [Chaetomium strumarium]
MAPQAPDDCTGSGSPTRDDDATLHLPRILCLHGGGTNARIFRAQCRVIRLHLAASFRLVFAEGPFSSPPSPDVESVYGEWGPFRSWLPPAPGKVSDIDIGSIDSSIAAAVRADDEAGATGRCVGLLGFSQGAGVAASLLWRQQRRDQSQASGGDMDMDMGVEWERAVGDYRFAVLIAGRPLSMPLATDTALKDVAADEPVLLRLPTIHVHGLRDPGLAMHRSLLHDCCQKSTARVVEWDGDHRVPIRTDDVVVVVAQIYDVAFGCGILGE